MVVLVTLAVAGCVHRGLESANALLEAGDFMGAKAIYAHAIARSPRSFAAHYGMGMASCAEAIYKTDLGFAEPADWYPAVYHMTVAAGLGQSDKVRPTLAIMHYNLGAAYRKEGRNDAAISRFEQALAYDSTQLKAANLLGAMYHEAGDLDKAERCYRLAVAAKPDYAMAHFNLGAVAWARADYAGAREHLARAASLAPGNAHIADWYERAGELAAGGGGGRRKG